MFPHKGSYHLKHQYAVLMEGEPALKNVIIIVQIGWGQKEHLERSKEVGINYHLVKPIHIETLKQLLEKIYASREPQIA